METRIERFALRMTIACFVAMMAFAPATLLAGGNEKQASGKQDIIASSSSSSEEGKKGSTEDAEKDKEDANKGDK